MLSGGTSTYQLTVYIPNKTNSIANISPLFSLGPQDWSLSTVFNVR